VALKAVSDANSTRAETSVLGRKVWIGPVVPGVTLLRRPSRNSMWMVMGA